MIRILKNCEKEIADFPLEIKDDLMEAMIDLERGNILRFPLSRPMPTIGKGYEEDPTNSKAEY